MHCMVHKGINIYYACACVRIYVCMYYVFMHACMHFFYHGGEGLSMCTSRLFVFVQ